MHVYSGEAQELINQWHTIQVRNGGKVVRRGSTIFINACDESVTTTLIVVIAPAIVAGENQTMFVTYSYSYVVKI